MHFDRRICLGTWIAMAALVGSAATPAAGQDRYRLDEEKTWTPLTQFDPDTPEGQLQAVRKLLAQSQGEEAFEAAGAWIESHPNHALLPEAYLLRADAQVLKQEYYEALFDYEYLIRHFPESEQFQTALAREFKIAELFERGMKRKLWGMRILKADEEAEELFIRIQERVPGSRLGERASLALGDYYFNRSEMGSAAEAYDLFMINYPHSEKRQTALLQLIRANLATFKGPRFDASGLIEAAERIKTYEREFPLAAEKLGTEALLVRIRESLALKDFHTAEWYEGQGENVSAMTLYERIARDYPKTAVAERALKKHHDLVTGSEQADDDTPPEASDAPAEPAPAEPETAP